MPPTLLQAPDIHTSVDVEPSNASVMSRYESRTSELRQLQSRSLELEAQAMTEDLPEGFASHLSDSIEEQEKPMSGAFTTSSKPSSKALFFSLPFTEVWTLLNIVNWSIWGVLARLGLIALTEYDGSYLGGVVWANFAACFVMGWAVESKAPWISLLDENEPKSHSTHKVKGTIPVYVGVTTGFCGTCSSFSSFMLEAFHKSANTLPETYLYPNAAYGIMDVFAVILAQISISVGGFHAGRHLSRVLDGTTPKFTYSAYKRVEAGISVVGICAYIVVIVLLGVKSDSKWRSWMFLCLFSPWAAIGRYVISKKLNPKVKNFPMGTFTVNTVGTLLLAIFTILQRGRSSKYSNTPLVNSKEGCRVLVGLDNGFCGTFTTVSTFVSELFALSTAHDYSYGFTTVVIGYILMMLIVGSYNWTIGLVPGACK